MSTTYVYNGFDKNGTTLYYAGQPFFFPYDRVVPLPNWTFRELDHNASTGGAMEGPAENVYRSEVVTGTRLVEELLIKKPSSDFSPADMGIMPVTGRNTGKMIWVHAGVAADVPQWRLDSRRVPEEAQPCPVMGDGTLCVRLHVEVPEKIATDAEKTEAAERATRYKQQIVQAYLQSKRERMSGGTGQKFPNETVRAYMEELNIEDLDDLSAHTKSKDGARPELIHAAVRAAMEGSAELVTQGLVEAVKEIRTGSNAKRFLRPRPKHAPKQPEPASTESK